jgi:hypothetical protein
MNDGSSKAIPDGLKWWLFASVALLLFSLLLFVGNVVATFVYFSAGASPLWVTVLGAAGILGICAGFGGLFLTMAVFALKARREDKRRAAEQG